MTVTGMLCALAASAALWLAPASPAQATGPAAVTCGSTITTDTTLTHDLLDCPGAGLVIGADDVTLDLNGHLIDGDGTSGRAGVEAVGHDRIAVKNGSIRDFAEGVLAVETTGVVVRYLHVSRSDHVGILVVDAAQVSLLDNAVVETAFAGIAVFESSDVVISDNLSSRNGAGINVTDTPRTTIATNLVTRNGFAGVIVESNRAIVRHNTIRRHGVGVIIYADRVLLAQNFVVDTVGCVTTSDDCVSPPPGPCPTCDEGVGISVEGGDGNRVRANLVRRTLSAGIRVAAYDPNRPTQGTIVVDNRVRRAGRDGISVSVGQAGTIRDVLVAHNRALESGDDGIDVRLRTTTVTANVAVQNGDYGITAVRGARDGGGNRARDNGHRPQCRNISCTR